jgi:cell division protein FtsW
MAQTVVNLGVIVGWVPPKGLVLPFLSYGASAVMIHVVCVALLLRVGLESAGGEGRR